MTRTRTWLVVLSIGLPGMSAHGTQPVAPNCEPWNTAGFFRTASPSLVAACIAAGASLEELSEPVILNVHDYRNAKTPLHAAVNENATAAIEILLAAGANPNGLDGSRFAPLHTAIFFSPSAIALLLEAGADVHARAENGGGATPLHYVARSGFDSAAQVQLLLEAGADVDARDRDGSTPLHYAAEYNSSPAVFTALLVAGADVNARDDDGRTPVFHAAVNLPAFELLLEAGGDVSTRDDAGGTLLHAAAHGDDPAVLELLLAAGADVNARNDRNQTPLHSAAMWSGWEDNLRGSPWVRSSAVVETLLAAGASVDARAAAGCTPLHCAAALNHNPAVIEVLLAAGADVNASNHRGDTPFDLSRHRPAIRAVLLAARRP